MSTNPTKPSRALDREVAEKVFGYSIYHYDKDYREHCYYLLWDENGESVADSTRENPRGERKTEAEAWDDCPRFSESIAAAWQVVERMLDHKDQRVFLAFVHAMAGFGWCTQEYLACPRICLAALKAVSEVPA